MPNNENPSLLRVGLLLDGLVVPAWTRAVVEDVQNSEIADVRLVVLNDPMPEQSRRAKLLSRRNYLLYEAYSRLDISVAAVGENAFERQSLEPLLEGVDRLNVLPRRTKYSDYITESDVQEIVDAELDVLLRFGFRILRGEVLGAARQGVWSYHHGDPDAVRGGPPGFWEVMLGMDSTGVVLQKLTEDLDGGAILQSLRTSTNHMSVRRNKNHLYWAAVPMVKRALADVANATEPPSESGTVGTYDRPLYRKPRNLQFAPLLGRFGGRATASKLSSSLTRSEWFVAASVTDPAKDGAQPLFRYRELANPSGAYWADPFPIEVGDETWIFVEEYSYTERRGRIVGLLTDENGEVADQVPALERLHHLSYPSVFKWSGELWMTPESAENRSVELYRCHRFPDDWRLEAALLTDIRAVDPTIHEDGKRFWLFTNIASPGSTHAHDELHLFMAERPTGPWTPHPMNPVVADARRARPAGRLYRDVEGLVRPGQDCSGRYGRAISLNRVTRLDDEVYSEEPATTIEPEWAPGLLATHTINRAGALSVVDAMRRTPVWRR